jgi:hypothetical protein
MKILYKLEGIRTQYKRELSEILNFVNATEKLLNRKKKIKLEKNDLEELDIIIDGLQKTFAMKSGDTMNIPLNSKAVEKLLIGTIVTLKHLKFLTEMTLSYLISYQEAMLKDYL